MNFTMYNCKLLKWGVTRSHGHQKFLVIKYIEICRMGDVCRVSLPSLYKPNFIWNRKRKKDQNVPFLTFHFSITSEIARISQSENSQQCNCRTYTWIFFPNMVLLIFTSMWLFLTGFGKLNFCTALQQMIASYW